MVVFDSADQDFMFPHVDVTKVAQYTAEAAKAGGPGDESLGMLFRKLSGAPVVTIAKLRGRARAAGSEFVLACDMRFASRERAILSQPEVGLGLAPGAGGVQHLTRLLGRGRALEVILSSEDVDADLAERYGWVNRALPDAELDEFVERLAHRIAGFPAEAVTAAKAAVNALTLAAPDEVRSDARLFQRLVRTTRRSSAQPSCSSADSRPAAPSNSTWAKHWANSPPSPAHDRTTCFVGPFPARAAFRSGSPVPPGGPPSPPRWPACRRAAASAASPGCAARRSLCWPGWSADWYVRLAKGPR